MKINSLSGVGRVIVKNGNIESLYLASNIIHLEDKTILCYYNCTLPPYKFHWYGFSRTEIYKYYLSKSFVNIENCLQNPRPLNNNLFINYFEKLKKSKFMICPRGCAIDTYRIWDCLYMGCIPIVLKYEGYHYFTDLPILFVEKEEDFFKLEEKELEQIWKEYLDKEWNYEKLKMSFWKKLIQESNHFV